MEEKVQMVMQKHTTYGFKKLENSTFIGLHKIVGHHNYVSVMKKNDRRAYYDYIEMMPQRCLKSTRSGHNLMFDHLVCKLKNGSAINFINERMFLLSTYDS